MNLFREQSGVQALFLIFSLVFLAVFVGMEWDGMVAFGDMIVDAIASTPDFVSDIIDYFANVPGPEFRRSLLVGAIFGAVSTAIVYLAARGWLQIPALGTEAAFGGLAGVIVCFYGLDMSFWYAVIIGILVAVVVGFVRQDEVREFLTLHTLRRLNDPQALRIVAIGSGIGAVVGASGAQIFMYPLKHCVYEPDIPALQYRLGLVVTAFSALFLLVPAWTLLTGRLTAQRRVDTTIGFFRNRAIPYLFLLPSLVFLAVFLYYPAIQILTQSTVDVRRGSDRTREMCLQQFIDLSESPAYQNSFTTTAWMTVAIVVITMVVALGIAILASQKVNGANIYRTLLIWPYAISPIVMGAIFLNMFRQGDEGIINWALGHTVGIQPDWLTDPDLAPWVIVGAAVWNGLGFNILFYVAGLQNIPPDMHEAAAIDGANRVQRFFRITLPLLSPFTFFLLVANVTYSFYGIYGVVDVLTEGGPVLGPAGRDGGATRVLIYSAYYETFEPSAKIGAASAQAVVLFLLVAGITLLQFRYLERRVTYGGA